jgi:hypothetical protein
MPFPNWIGKKRLWTREKVLAALSAAAREIKGPLPCSDQAWNDLKRGRLDWPPAVRILGYFHGMARGWQAAGVPIKRISMKNLIWLPEEDAYLLDKAGMLTLKRIAAKLGRSYSAVRTRLNKNYGIASRHNQGYVSAAELSKEYNCPCHRIRLALTEGKIKGHYDQLRNRWQIDLNDLTPEAKEILTRPKRTHKTCPTDLGDYYSRHGLKRTIIDDRLVVVAK